jgi:hypothetical protein
MNSSSSYTPESAERIGAELQSLGGILRCTVCKREEPLMSVAMYLQHGWPRCHSVTMLWVTQKQLDEGHSHG